MKWATYLLSNICPMVAKLNRGKWAENEREVCRLAERGTVHVLVYPVFSTNTFPRTCGQGLVFCPPERFVKAAWG